MTDLDVITVGAPKAETAVVLLHGWGAPGDDLVPLAEAMVRPGVRFHVPAAPLPEVGGGRAWWHLDDSRPAYAHEGEAQPHAAVAAARSMIQQLVAGLGARQVYLGGFSQGAMLALDVALAEGPAVDKVFALSGVLLAASLTGLTASKARPPVFVAHGRMDDVLSYRGGQRLVALLEGQGFPVTFRGFDGGHEIPAEVLAALEDHLFG
jgi:phospholipase/carboxylesterase